MSTRFCARLAFSVFFTCLWGYSTEAHAQATSVASAPLKTSQRGVALQHGTTSQRGAAFRPATPFSHQQISLRTLPNGVRSIVKQTRGTTAVSVQVWVRAGSRHQGARQDGAAHLVGVAAIHGSSGHARSGGGIERTLSSLGSELQVQTARDATNYAVTVATAFASDAVRALADAALNPDLSNAAVAAAKTHALNNIALRQSDPISVTSDLAYGTAFAKHPYRRLALGDEADIQSLTGARVREFHASRYRGAHISVVIVGDIAAARAHQLVAQFFRAAPRVVAPEVAITNDTFSIRTVKRTTAATRATTSLSFRAPGLATPEDVVAMDVLLSYWNDGRDARMRQLLLNSPTSTRSATDETPESAPENSPETSPEIAPALGLDIAFLTQRDPSLISFTFVTEPETTVDAEKVLLAEIARVRTQNISATELTRAKTTLSRLYVAQSETVSGQAGALGFYDVIGNYGFAVDYLDRIARITSADLRRVASRYLANGKFVRILVEPSPTSNPFGPDNPGADDEAAGGNTNA